jgi:NADH-quinone oxidoreductase subunit N
MVALIVIFISGLLSLFLAFAKKPWLVLLTASAGLIAGGISLFTQYYYQYDFIHYEGLKFDGFAVAFGLIAILFTLLVVLTGYSSFKDKPQHTGDYIALLLFSLTGALSMLAFTDMFMFFLGLEILSIPIYVMAGSNKEDVRSSEASLKYFMTGAFATGVLLFGIAWIYGGTASFKLDEIAAFINNAEGTHSSLIYIGLLMILSAFLFKVGAAPFHFWSPDVYDGSPHIVTGFMAAVVKLGAFGAFMKIFSVTFGGLHDFWAPALSVLAILTMFVGNLSALKQIRFKRLLAYSSITHVGYALLTIIVQSPDSAFNLWAYIFSYGFSTIGLITVAIIIHDEEDRIEAFRGLVRRNPFTGFVAILGLLSLAGVPPLIGFFGKFLVFSEAITQYPWLVAIAIVNSGIGIFYYLRMVILVLQKEDDDKPKTPRHKVPVLQMIVLAICALALLFGGNMLIF